MKRKRLTGWKRMAAFAMALTLTVGDWTSVGAAGLPQTDVQTVTEAVIQEEDAMEAALATEQTETESETDSESAENDSGQTENSEASEIPETSEASETEKTVEETENVNDTEAVDDTEVMETETEEESEEEIEEETEEETEEEELAAIDKPSKVINVRGKDDGSIITTASGRQLRYAYVNRFQNGVIAAGTTDEIAGFKITKRSNFWDKTVGLYKYENNYYGQCSGTDIDGFVNLYNKAEAILKGNTDKYQDAYGMYRVNGKTYRALRSCDATGYHYVTEGDEITEITVSDSSENAKKRIDEYAVKNDTQVLYYSYNGHFYKQLTYESVYDSASKKYKYVVYANAYEEISFEKTYVKISWNPVNNDTATMKNKAGDMMKVGYEVVCDGNTKVYNMPGLFLDASDGTVHEMITSDEARLPYVILNSGQQVSVKVRAVYYHEVTSNKQEVYWNWNDNSQYIIESKQTKYVVDMYGKWSDTYTYKNYSLKKLSPVTGTKVSEKGKEMSVTWNAQNGVDSYRVYYLRSSKPLNITNIESFLQFYNKRGTLYDAYVNAKGENDSYETDSEYASDPYCNITIDSGLPYFYCSVRLESAEEGYFSDGSYSDVITATASINGNIPTVKNLKIEKTYNGDDWQLSWTPIDADVVIYVFEEGKKPAHYNYELLNAYGYYTDGQGQQKKLYLKDALTELESKEISSYVRSYKVKGIDGSYSAISLKPGVKYTFVAHTYDAGSSLYNIQKKPVFTVNKEIKVTDAQKNQTYKNISVGMTYYTAMSPASNMVSYTDKVSVPRVYTKAGKNSIKLSFTRGSCTGYEIYRLSGKKYKKIATTTDYVYTDQNLKAGTKYSYKVRSYYYDPDRKTKSYSIYKNLTVSTSRVNNIVLKVAKNSKNTVKLTWTKVGFATKYEIYRTSESDKDITEISGWINSGNSAVTVENTKYELVKTITNAKTTTYTDKKLKFGESYTYLICAYYKDGKTLKYITASTRVKMQLEEPRNLVLTNKGKNVSVKWDADKYAAGYQIRYMVYDKYGEKKTVAEKYVTVKKNKYTIKGLSSGEYVNVSVRAYNSQKEYSGWSSSKESTSLAAVKSIKAVYDTKKNAVKITWKKVKGAKYYKVVRSVYTPLCNTDEKLYAATGNLIAKDSNDETGYYSEVHYREYYGEDGSITGTAAYDRARLKKGVKYYYMVSAYGEKGTRIASYMTSEYGTQVASGKPAVIIYGVKVAAKVKNNKKGTVTVSYNKVTGAKTYQIYRAEKKNGKYTLIGTTKKTSFADKKAKKKKTYYYKVVVNGRNELLADFTIRSSAVKIKVKK